MKLKKTLIVTGVTAIVLSCATNPFSGKKTMAFVSNDQLFPTSFAQYNQFLSENKVVTGTADATMVTRVGQRIAKAAERYLDANGYQGYLNDYKWEYNLVDDKTVNAWCMPGGKIVVYTGILPVTKNETALAAVVGHEVAHALANHGQQRMSAAYVQQGVALAGNIALSGDQKSLDVFNQAYGVGSQVGVMLPFSRAHETEADEIGLYLMAIAGYNPEEAAELWKRMDAVGGEAPPEMLSTHPSNESRIANLTALAPKAKAEAAKFGVTSFK